MSGWKTVSWEKIFPFFHIFSCYVTVFLYNPSCIRKQRDGYPAISRSLWRAKQSYLWLLNDPWWPPLKGGVRDSHTPLASVGLPHNGMLTKWPVQTCNHIEQPSTCSFFYFCNKVQILCYFTWIGFSAICTLLECFYCHSPHLYTNIGIFLILTSEQQLPVTAFKSF